VRHSLREALYRIRSSFRTDPLDQELNEEMASHLQMAVEENLRRGMAAEEARRQAAVRLAGSSNHVSCTANHADCLGSTS
jgi:putative ABC transport system permease protein